MKRLTTLLIICLTGIGLSCMDSSLGPIPDPLSKTPRADYSAENMALFFSSELTAPDTLYEQFHHDLSLIEAKYGDWIERWKSFAYFARRSREELSFEPYWWFVSYVKLWVEPSAHNRMVHGEYQRLNVVLEKFGGTLEPFLQLFPDSGVWWDYVRFEGRLNSKLLCEYFEGMDGVLRVSTVGDKDPDWTNGRSVIMPVLDGSNRCYCYEVGSRFETMDSKWYYFSIRDNEAVFVDSFAIPWGTGTFPEGPPWVDSVGQQNRVWQADRGHFWNRE